MTAGLILAPFNFPYYGCTDQSPLEAWSLNKGNFKFSYLFCRKNFISEVTGKFKFNSTLFLQ